MKGKRYYFVLEDKEWLMKFTEKFLKRSIRDTQIYNLEEVMKYFLKEVEEEFNRHDTFHDAREMAHCTFTDVLYHKYHKVNFSDIEDCIKIIEVNYKDEK